MGYNKKKKQLSKKNRQTKQILVFDEHARKDYLTGFHKRKNERKKKAQEQVKRMITEERKRLKLKTKEFLAQRDQKRQPMPLDLEKIASQEVTELPEHTVTITDISDIDLAGHGGTRLGLNTGNNEDDSGEELSDKGDNLSDIDETATPEVSIAKRDLDIRRIKNKIRKTTRHVKMKSNQKRSKKLLSKKTKQKRKIKSRS
ncbi:Nucleolar protein 12 [Mactra antiquata]